MKIIECCPFYNENLVADIHIRESENWVDEIHIVETDRTFQYNTKSFNFLNSYSKVKYHAENVATKFRENRKYIPYIDFGKRHSKHGYFWKTSWYNEQVQRNMALALAGVSDDDIVVLSDIDEIIDSRYADQIVETVKKHGIMTVRLHFTVFYLNLFSRNWGGPANYSYRVFVATGRKLREDWRGDSDLLRKSGEAGRLYDLVCCPDEIMGFHHSWLGDEKWISDKLSAYAHTEHSSLNDPAYIRQCLAECRSIFPGHELYRDGEIQLLTAIQQSLDKFGGYLL